MRYTATADTDMGTARKANEDSLLIRHASYPGGEVLLAAVCDGMGGLSNGSLASAAVIRAFARWFDRELPFELQDPSIPVIGGKWANLLKGLNLRIRDYAKANGIAGMGTTFSGLLFLDGEYVLAHVGDSRIYRIGDGMEQLTKDQTFVAREVERGRMSAEQARTDKRRNLLLQCIGASGTVEPQIRIGKAEAGAYLLCTDGLRHELTEAEMFQTLDPAGLTEKGAMHSRARHLIGLARSREEKDNISVILIKAG